MSGAYSAEKSGSLASALSMSLHGCTSSLGPASCDDDEDDDCEEDEEETPERVSSETRLSSDWKLTSLKVVACRKFCTAVTGVGSQSTL